MSSLSFRNVDAAVDDAVDTWPFEALVTALDRGLVADWRPVFDEIRRMPWGPVARRLERHLARRDPDAVATLFRLAVARARSDAEATERAEVARRVRTAVADSGLTQTEFARLVGTSASRLSTYASGRVSPSAALLVRIEAAGRATP